MGTTCRIGLSFPPVSKHPPWFLALHFSLLFLFFFLFSFLSRVKKKNKPLNLKIHNSVGSCENIPAQRSPLLSERSLRSFFVGYPPFLPSTPPVHTEATFSASKSRCPPQPPRLPLSMGWATVDAKRGARWWDTRRRCGGCQVERRVDVSQRRLETQRRFWAYISLET